MKDLISRLGSEYTDGYFAKELPCPIDNDVQSVLRRLKERWDPQMLGMTAVHGNVLVVFAERMANYGVRARDAELLEQALWALAIAAKLVYYKEVLPIVSLVYRSAELLGLDTRSLFLQGHGPGGGDFDEYLARFVERSAKDRSIEAMGYVESQGVDGVIYKRTW